MHGKRDYWKRKKIDMFCSLYNLYSLSVRLRNNIEDRDDKSSNTIDDAGGCLKDRSALEYSGSRSEKRAAGNGKGSNNSQGSDIGKGTCYVVYINVDPEGAIRACIDSGNLNAVESNHQSKIREGSAGDAGASKSGCAASYSNYVQRIHV